MIINCEDFVNYIILSGYSLFSLQTCIGEHLKTKLSFGSIFAFGTRGELIRPGFREVVSPGLGG